MLILPLGLFLSGLFGFWLGSPHFLNRRSEFQNWLDYLYPIAIAFFLGFVFATLVPHVFFHQPRAIPAFALGVLCMWFLNRKVFHQDPCCEGGHNAKGFGIVSAAAMSICSLNDGLLLGLLVPPVWSSLNLGMTIHKITSTFAVAQILQRSRYKGFSLWIFGILYNLVSPAAYYMGIMGLVGGERYQIWALGFSTGLLSYMAIANMLPHAKTIFQTKPKSRYVFAVVLLFSLGLGLLHQSYHEALEERFLNVIHVP